MEMLDSFPGSYMPETKWLLYAENAPAPLCRKPGGSYMAEDDSMATVEPTSGAGGPVGAGKSVVAQTVAQDDGAYRGRFQLVDDQSREPLANHPYTVTSADGQTIRGTTDASGHTDWLSSHQASSLTFEHVRASDQ
ncbi:hypothetical protein [Burkholderia thailandensis]|uniref:hypothetical protein n=1 Tax=Burkholderia thailandensis TaxID=57975 RepID=UPI00217D8AAD|nr:hypothetical protein [Burkholderia thailandensis]MCS6520706.1 hypothetical protein [Burkholderia thailandensis]